MKIVEINTFNYGSTGNVMLNTANAAQKRGHTVFFCCPDYAPNRAKNLENQIIIGKRWRWLLHSKAVKLTGLNGCFSVFDTFVFLRKIKKINPDIIHLHNLHCCYINLPMLFRFIKKNRIPVVWTLHDCWSFTGQCPHFTFEKCEKWKTGCNNCPKYREYPGSFVDRTKTMYRLKKKWFNGVPDMTLVTPSDWLSNMVKESFLRNYTARVINNGINLSYFKPTPSDFRKKWGIRPDMYMILGVAFDWGYKKGLDVFIKLAEILDPEKYKIVIVGTNQEIDDQLPENIISIRKTQNKNDLAKIYTAADVFVNPTREDTFPTVNTESLACGTPVAAFKTGGSPEMLSDDCSSVVPYNDVEALISETIRICEEKPYKAEKCIERASGYNVSEKFLEYVEIFEEKSKK